MQLNTLLIKIHTYKHQIKNKAKRSKEQQNVFILPFQLILSSSLQHGWCNFNCFINTTSFISILMYFRATLIFEAYCVFVTCRFGTVSDPLITFSGKIAHIFAFFYSIVKFFLFCLVFYIPIVQRKMSALAFIAWCLLPRIKRGEVITTKKVQWINLNKLNLN